MEVQATVGGRDATGASALRPQVVPTRRPLEAPRRRSARYRAPCRPRMPPARGPIAGSGPCPAPSMRSSARRSRRRSATCAAGVRSRRRPAQVAHGRRARLHEVRSAASRRARRPWLGRGDHDVAASSRPTPASAIAGRTLPAALGISTRPERPPRAHGAPNQRTHRPRSIVEHTIAGLRGPGACCAKSACRARTSPQPVPTWSHPPAQRAGLCRAGFPITAYGAAIAVAR